MSASGSGEVIGLGELLWDEFPDGRRPGGAPANVAYHATMLGLPAAVASRVGRDESGDRLTETIRQNGLDVSLIQTDPEADTGRVTIELDDGEPSYSIHPAAWDHIEAGETLLARAGDAAAVCFGTLAQRSEVSRDTIQQCVATGASLKVYDVNLRQSFFTKDTVAASLAAADLVKLNRDETGTLAKLLDLPAGDDFAPAVRERFEVELVCVTLGPDGCELVADDRVLERSDPVELADAVGAGDAFTAALTFATLQRWPLSNRARLANAIGGLVASRRGAMPSIADEAAAIRDRIAAG